MTPRDPETQEIQATLKGLVRAADESEFAYLDARQREPDAELRALYDQYAEERARFKHELEFRIRRLGVLTHGNEDTLDEDAAPSPDDPQLASDPVQAERKSLTLYEKALDLDLPGDLHEVVERQAVAVGEAREHIAGIRTMRGGPEAG